jgi:hyperosmotically inducible periplasmic protein
MNRKAVFSFALAAVVAGLFLVSLPLRASDADDQMESSFKNTYVYRTYLHDDAIKIEAKAGVVTLTGTVADEYHKALAQDTVAGMPGVTRVDNQLTTKAEAAADKVDTWIERKLTLALLFHRHVDASKTTISVTDGVVTLKGEASSMAQKELTTEYAKDIEGVKDVKNEMTVAGTSEPAERTIEEKIDDASITAQVKLALLTHHSTSAISTKVETRNGEVTLGGIAKNDAEKALVGKLVADIKGVTSVTNQMTIKQD